ncbi:MAG: thymidine phosphorylase [Clostridia bacterium]|nr:thymidine phosphorylase [Clostridia bacterium]MBR5987578.1 thymidine phosphorylase [Clostridia bacterium]
MDAIDLVKKGARVGKPALKEIVDGYLSGKVSKETMTEFLRAVCACGLSDEDATLLTEVMVESGERLSFTPRKYPYADKHSTGGVADSTTLVIAPVVASCGVPFLKMSGRKLGHTGGTIDKLECFKGLRTEISVEEAERIVDKVGAAVIAQSKELVPADKAMYKLRDETGTVKSLPLIASSVVSKKLASGAEVFVLDVKTGAGAFMETVEEGTALAKLMVNILKKSGKKAAAVLSDMNSPLGEGVGGVMEVIDAVEVLEGKKSRLRDLALAIAGKIVALAKGVSDEEGAAQAAAALDSGKALSKLKEMIAAQGGALDLFEKQERASLLSQAAGIVRAEQDGYVAAIDCVKLGFLAREFEASGGYGMLVPVKVGSAVKKGDALVRLYGEAAKGDALHALSACFSIVEARVKPDPLIYKTIT